MLILIHMVLPTLTIETELIAQGYRLIAGVDEVGRGSWVGPVVAGAVILPSNCQLPQFLRDSKLLSKKQRQVVNEEVKQLALGIGIGLVELSIINEIGIGKATQLAFRRAIRALPLKPDFIVIDAFYIEKLKKEVQKPIINGDKICASIAAASVVAKVFRDALLDKLHVEAPHYKWAQNKGYGTVAHRQAIRQFGLSKYHRTSFDLNSYT